ncbi:hypothetical protein AN477_19730 [Alicyclobacillus ferrooxydans]|uniref:LysM domain-containing protein n=1 Tax=Alicyclobacillus ferrooxydans TaxID=471514 RepID=A0A0P9CG54_9BACL|nr:hypothetical protein AN477_19730 [Alicyclobacillus ferrooxydans]
MILLALLKWTALVMFLAASIVAVNARLNAFYGTHITSWHLHTVKAGETLYGIATASNAGYPMAVEQEIEKKNGLGSSMIRAGEVIQIPEGR